MRIADRSLFICLAAWIYAGGPALALSCHGTQRPKEVAELFFGRDIGNRVSVSEARWAQFIAREVTPRFPDGLTVTDATGQWRNPASGRIAREPSKHVEIVMPGRADDEARLDAIAAAYKRAFRQRSVGIVVYEACASF